MTPLVSVCMTTYNHEPYLAKAIESVLMQQTTFDVELVLGEDCSTDRTYAICVDYATRYPDRIRLLPSERNLGWRANYRRTFDACRGCYVAYLDGDDWWSDETKLQQQVDWMTSHPTYGMCYTTAKNFWPAENRCEEDHREHFTDLASLLCRLTITNCATLARRDAIERYYAEVRPEDHPEWLTDDAPMWLWFAACSKIGHLPTTTAVHRRLEQSVSHSPDYAHRIAFCDSLMAISLWMDCRYNASRCHFAIHRRRSSVALWVLSRNGSVGAYLRRWAQEIKVCPKLLLMPEGIGLFIKKILFFSRKP